MLLTAALLLQLATDSVQVSRLGYQATKAATAGAVTLVGKELGLRPVPAAVLGALAGPTVGHIAYLVRGQPGGPWPSVGFAPRDFASEVAWGAWPLWMTWARRGGWWRWPVAALGYGVGIRATWSWGTP